MAYLSGPGTPVSFGADWLLLFALGMTLGSFLNVVIHRLPRGESLIHPGSRCPECSARIRPLDNIPLMGFLLLRGRCRRCGTRISWQYPAVEFITGVVFIAFYFKHGLTAEFARAMVLSCVLIAQSAIDLQTMRLSDGLTLLLVPLGLGFAVDEGWSGLGASLLGGIVGAGALALIGLAGETVLKREAMGMGDIKLAGACGTSLGWAGSLLSLYLAFVFGAVVLLPLVAIGRVAFGRRVSFGPFICAGVLVYLAVGDAAREWLVRM